MTDLEIARKFIGKADRARIDGIEFDLTFTSFKNLMRGKRCAYTGIELTEPRKNKPIMATDRTVDRIDNNIGYVAGNVVAVCHAANKIKSVWENPTSPLTLGSVGSMVKKISSLTLDGRK